MSAKRPYIGPSESQSAALERRDAPFAPENRTSAGNAYDWRRRQDPRDLRDAVRLVRRAYQDEVPTRMHNRDLADDGTPKMTPQTEAYMFGAPTWTDAGSRPKCARDCRFHPDNVFGDLSDGGRNHEPHCPAHQDNQPLISYYATPFRATLDGMERGPEPEAKRAAIIRHITFGSQGPQEAAIAEGVPLWCAKTVAEDAIRSFLRRLSDVRVDAASVAA